MSTSLRPEIDSINKLYWDGLAEGRLLFQSCACGHRWLPARALCPNCLKTDWHWQQAGGRGKIKSWVVYHVAYHESVQDKLPYNVALVELEEGPRLLTNIVGDDPALAAEVPVRLTVNTTGPTPLALFELAKED